MVTIQVPRLPILDSIEDYLAEGTNATEFRETVNRAAETFYQSEAHNYKNVALRLAIWSRVPSHQGHGTPG